MASQPPPDTDFPAAPAELPEHNSPEEAPQQEEAPGFDPPSPDFDQPDTGPIEMPPD